MSRIHISIDADPSVFDYFSQLGETVLPFEGTKAYEAVRNHPDLYMFFDDHLFIEPSLTYMGTVCEAIGDTYPDNVAFNAAKVGSFIICHPDHVSRRLKKHFDDKGYVIIPVKQGYAKCSTLVVDETSIITSDRGIARAARRHKLEVLLIEPGYIELKGMAYGFIGGCGVRYKDRIFFSGDVRQHPDFQAMKAFIEDKQLTIDWSEGPLRDIGSIIIESVTL